MLVHGHKKPSTLCLPRGVVSVRTKLTTGSSQAAAGFGRVHGCACQLHHGEDHDGGELHLDGEAESGWGASVCLEGEC